MNPMTVLTTALKVIEVLSLAVDVMDRMVDVFKKAGILKETNNSEELGAKVLYGNEHNITPPNPEDKVAYDDYITQIDSTDLSTEDAGRFSAEDKRKAASEFITGTLNSEYGSNNINDFLIDVATNSDYYSADKIKAYMDVAANKEDLDMGNIPKYFNGQLNNFKDIKETEEAMVEAEQSLGVTEEEAKQNIDVEQEKRNKQI